MISDLETCLGRIREMPWSKARHTQTCTGAKFMFMCCGIWHAQDDTEDEFATSSYSDEDDEEPQLSNHSSDDHMDSSSSEEEEAPVDTDRAQPARPEATAPAAKASSTAGIAAKTSFEAALVAAQQRAKPQAQVARSNGPTMATLAAAQQPGLPSQVQHTEAQGASRQRSARNTKMTLRAQESQQGCC